MWLTGVAQWYVPCFPQICEDLVSFPAPQKKIVPFSFELQLLVV